MSYRRPAESLVLLHLWLRVQLCGQFCCSRACPVFLHLLWELILRVQAEVYINSNSNHCLLFKISLTHKLALILRMIKSNQQRRLVTGT